MIDPKSGGPAFPSHLQFSGRGECANSDATLSGGMSLRDYFAGQVVAASIATYGEQWGEAVAAGRQVEWVVKNAYAVADAMLAARGAKS